MASQPQRMTQEVTMQIEDYLRDALARISHNSVQFERAPLGLRSRLRTFGEGARAGCRIGGLGRLGADPVLLVLGCARGGVRPRRRLEARAGAAAARPRARRSPWPGRRWRRRA